MKYALYILGPLVLIGAIVGGLFVMGVLKLPGAKPAVAKTDTPPSAPAKKPTPKPKLARKPAPTASIDVKKGAEALAGLWNQMDTPTLLAVTKDWKDDDLVVVLAQMEEAKVAEYLTAVAKVKAQHASVLSKLVEKHAGAIPVEQS